ncbi:ArnT family glycosyltransferase [Spirochaetota bacterium]
MLSFIVLFSCYIRFDSLSSLPAGLFCDEAAVGYNAYSIAQHGMDENGNKFPLYFESFVNKKNPVYIYVTAVFIKLFGLSSASTRAAAALFGVIAILGVFWICYELWGSWAGIIGAALMSITPWNFHFSRIAFELIAMPALFVIAFAFLIRAIKRGRFSWIGAGFFLGMTVHSYIMASVFIPMFLLAFFITHARKCIDYITNIRSRSKFPLIGLLLFLIIIAPALSVRFKERKERHFQNVTWLKFNENFNSIDAVKTYFNNYKVYYSHNFLFKDGDNNMRHSIRNHGPLFSIFLPFILLGILCCLVFINKNTVLLFIWLLFYAVGPALTVDFYTTRSIIGSPLAPIFISYGFICIFTHIRKIEWKNKAFIAYAGLILLFMIPLIRQATNYFRRYFTEYAKESATSIYGFQYGYEEIIEYIETYHPAYKNKLLTATMVNRPEMIVNFYLKYDPLRWIKDKQNGYIITRPYNMNRYHLDTPTIYALWDYELLYFKDYEVKHKVLSPNGNLEFIIADIKSIKNFIPEWAIIGIFSYDRMNADLPSYSAPYKTFGVKRNSINGLDSQWKKYKAPYIHLNFDEYFGVHHRYNPSSCYAEAVTYIKSPQQAAVALDIWGTDDLAIIYLNGEIILSKMPSIRFVEKKNITLRTGWNELFIQSIETMGEWYINITIDSKDQNMLNKLKYSSIPPAGYVSVK